MVLSGKPGNSFLNSELSLPSLRRSADITAENASSSSSSSRSTSAHRRRDASYQKDGASVFCRDGGVYYSSVGLEDLPGLKAWVMARASVQVP